MKEPTEFQYFKAWLLFVLCALGCTWLINLVLGSFIAAALGAGGASLAAMGKVVGWMSFLISLPVSYVAFRAVVGKYLMQKIAWDD
jgi:hypothetical protein